MKNLLTLLALLILISCSKEESNSNSLIGEWRGQEVFVVFDDGGSQNVNYAESFGDDGCAIKNNLWGFTEKEWSFKNFTEGKDCVHDNTVVYSYTYEELEKNLYSITYASFLKHEDSNGNISTREEYCPSNPRICEDAEKQEGIYHLKVIGNKLRVISAFGLL